MVFWTTILGGFLATIGGVVVFFFQENHRQKAEKRKVARALFFEMLSALKFLAAGYRVLTNVSKQHGSVPVSEISQAHPSRRAIYVALGQNIGALSEKAAEAAVNFDHYMQALERDFEFEVGNIHSLSTIDPNIALKLANKISRAIELTTGILECMASEAFGDPVPEATKEIIRGLIILVENKVSH